MISNTMRHFINALRGIASDIELKCLKEAALISAYSLEQGTDKKL